MSGMSDMFGSELLQVIIIGSLLFIAGWTSGRRAFQRQSTESPAELSRYYYEGIGHLINEQPDRALDVFMNALEVSPRTLELYLALGELYRRKGEVDRAITLHYKLLHSPNLSRQKHEEVTLALACDYLAAGLLDRAEDLLEALQKSISLKDQALEYLVHIYEQEKEWEKAIEAAQRLRDLGQQEIQCVLAHYHCELAERALKEQQPDRAKACLHQALHLDALCVRASLRLGQMAYQERQLQEALNYFGRISKQDMAYLPEVLSPLKACYEQLGLNQEWIAFLRQCLEAYPGIDIVLALADKTDPDQAAQMIEQYLQDSLSPRGLKRLLEYQMVHCEEATRKSLSRLQAFIQKFIEERPAYACNRCGYAAKSLYWKCPGCDHWGTMRPLQGLECIRG